MNQINRRSLFGFAAGAVATIAGTNVARAMLAAQSATSRIEIDHESAWLAALNGADVQYLPGPGNSVISTVTPAGLECVKRIRRLEREAGHKIYPGWIADALPDHSGVPPLDRLMIRGDCLILQAIAARIQLMRFGPCVTISSADLDRLNEISQYQFAYDVSSIQQERNGYVSWWEHSPLTAGTSERRFYRGNFIEVWPEGGQ